MKKPKPIRRVPGLTATLILLLSFVGFAWQNTDSVSAQAQNGISEPQPGDTLSGIVVVSGTATDDAFLRYELAFSNGADWIVFAEGDRPVVGGTLAIWDTTVGQPQNPVFPDGSYQLRLRVVRQDYNYDEYFVRDLTVSNSGTPTPTPTPTAPGTTSPALATPTVLPGTTESGVPVGRPTALPTLTPFPTPSRAVASNSGVVSAERAGPAPGASTGTNEGLLQRVVAIDTGRFSRAFWLGARLGLYLIALVPLYVLLRAVGRRLWRLLMAAFWQEFDR